MGGFIPDIGKLVDINMNLMKILILFLVSLGLSGCATSAVWSLGHEEESIKFKRNGRATISQDGDIAIEVIAEDNLYLPSSSTQHSKWLVIKKTEIQTEINKNKKETTNNYKIQIRQLVDVVPPPFANTNTDNIYFMQDKDYGLIARDENGYLSHLFYTDNGNKYELLYMNPRPGDPNKYSYERTRWWAYPPKIVLVMPALAIDLVTLPIEYWWFKEHNFGKP